MVEGSAELLFPLPFIKKIDMLRSAFFFDVGNVFSSDCASYQINCYEIDAGELRYSVGFGGDLAQRIWTIDIQLAKPLNSTPEDEGGGLPV